MKTITFRIGWFTLVGSGEYGTRKVHEYNCLSGKWKKNKLWDYYINHPCLVRKKFKTVTKEVGT